MKPPPHQRETDPSPGLFDRIAAKAREHPIRAALLWPVVFLLYAGVIYVVILIPFTPSVSDLRRARGATPTVVMSTDGVALAEYKRLNREWVPLEHVSPHVIDALIATEDRRFYQHHGIDFRRTLGAFRATISGDLQGGSTITQQLARNLFPEEIGRAPTLTRKIKEAITAIKLEAIYSKHDILETYLNTVPFLFNAFGIEMAARTYFDKSADRLNVLESATLVGMLKATSTFNPVLNPERAKERRNLVLAQMQDQGKLSSAEVARLSRRPLRLDFARQIEDPGLAPHVAQQIRKWLIEWADKHDYDIYSDGLIVRTTIDSRIQKAAVEAVEHQMARLDPLANAARRRAREDSVLQAGFLAMDPRNGFVRAWVGSRDFAEEQFDHVAQARRQPGSAFKPFVYGAAFMMGMKPTDTFIDQPPLIRVSNGEVWQPQDVSPPSYAPMTLRSGLAYSKNTITAQVMQKVGAERVVKLAQALGVRSSKLDPVPSLALGTSPVTLREMVDAYCAIANEGHHVEPMIVSRIEDRRGRVLAEFLPAREEAEAMPRDKALELVNVMRGVIDEGTGVAIRYRYGITADVAGKTGTTQENTDGWFIMMSPQLVAGARVGFNDKVTMGNWGQGSRSALPIVGEVFQHAFRNGWIDAKAEFAIPRPKLKPREPEPLNEPTPGAAEVMNRVVEDLSRFLRGESATLPPQIPQYDESQP
jgi:penicillin-binding protein 1A